MKASLFPEPGPEDLFSDAGPADFFAGTEASGASGKTGAGGTVADEQTSSPHALANPTTASLSSEPAKAAAQHLVLARKWRPRRFAAMVGQEHVVRALRHGLKTGRIHHAYLLTGTRGVGKTTIARILAKALNCESTSREDPDPCGHCTHCVQIDQGRFIDYIELDAASHRGVEDMVGLLENAVYAPTTGRWKVYVIDEVHMLSHHAFNAMLKTLEEPPGHVVFVLATTDPQKVPVTVLSRCLQLGLRNLAVKVIVEYLQMVLQEERVGYDLPALTLIAKAAAGSMRDALSLLDQAISHGGGDVRQREVRAMLGAIDRDQVAAIIDALLTGDVEQLKRIADQVRELGIDPGGVLQALATLVQDIALVEARAIEAEDARLQGWSSAGHATQWQVYWQILLHGKRDLALAPDEHAGLLMTLLRLHAFRPAVPESVAATRPANPAALGPVALNKVSREPSTETSPPGRTSGAEDFVLDCAWSALAQRVACSGFTRQFLEQSELLGIEGHHIKVRVPIRPLAEAATLNKVSDLLSAHFGRGLRISAEVGAVSQETASAKQEIQKGLDHQEALEGLLRDPFVRVMIDELGAEIVPESVKARQIEGRA
jgi:DNA polymerase-3 subunit gamma/tau